jgi:hypothetical protein
MYISAAANPKFGTTTSLAPDPCLDSVAHLQICVTLEETYLTVDVITRAVLPLLDL